MNEWKQWATVTADFLSARVKNSGRNLHPGIFGKILIPPNLSE